MTKNTLKQLIRKCINESVNENAFDKIAAKDFADIIQTMKKEPSDMDEDITNKYDLLHKDETDADERDEWTRTHKVDELYRELSTSYVLTGTHPSGKYPHKVTVKKNSYKGKGSYISLVAVKNFLGITLKSAPLLTITVDPKNDEYHLFDDASDGLSTRSVATAKSLEGPLGIMNLIKDRLTKILSYNVKYK